MFVARGFHLNWIPTHVHIFMSIRKCLERVEIFFKLTSKLSLIVNFSVDPRISYDALPNINVIKVRITQISKKLDSLVNEQANLTIGKKRSSFLRKRCFNLIIALTPAEASRISVVIATDKGDAAE